MSEWKEYRLDEFINIKHGFAFSGKYISQEENSVILVTPGNFHIGGGFKSDKLKYFSGEYPKEYVLNENDLIVTMTDLSKESDTLGYSAKIPKSNEKIYLHNQRIGLVEFKNENIDREYTYWLLRTKEYHWYIVGSASGTSIMHTSPSRIHNYVVLLPSLSEQKAIASILSSLDDKIDLLHRQNATLEKIAETLFRQWFVEEAKEDWEVSTIGENLTTILGGTPSTTKPEYWNGDIPWINSGEINKFRIIEPTRYITRLGLAKSNTKILPAGTTVIAITGATLGQISMLEIDTCANQSVVGIIPNEHFPKEFVFLWVKYMLTEIIINETGGAQPHINKGDVIKTVLIIPPKKVMREKIPFISDYFSKITNNNFQIRTLTTLRDTLLPKLMSGEVKVEM